MRKRRPSPCMQRKLRPERNTTHTPPYSITASTGTEWKRRQASHSKLRHMNVTVSARWRITLSRERPCQTGALHMTNSTETTTGSGIFCAMASRMENSFTRQARAPAMHGYAFKMASPHRSEEHTSELQTIMSISYAVLFLQKKNTTNK